jgi:LysM repeat protein
MQILDSRVRSSETTLSALKQQDLEKQQAKIDRMNELVLGLEKKWNLFEKKNGSDRDEIQKLLGYTGETSSILTQFKNRIEELEKEQIAQMRKLDAISKLKANIETLASSLQKEDSKIGLKTYRVRSGDSLEKIAKMHKTDVAHLKQWNHLESDLIVVGQELVISE